MLDPDAALMAQNPVVDAEAQAQADEARRSLVLALGHRLRTEFEKRRGERSEIETRWLKDVRQYNGEYEPEVKQVLSDRKYGSRAFVPLTRRICLLVEARIGDLLFPADDRNFVVSSSPIPELTDAEALAQRLPAAQPVDAGGGVATSASELVFGLRELREEAEKRAAGMQRAVDDQLQQSNYPTEARKVIHDALKLGTGVLKGPVVFGRRRKQWDTQGPEATLSMVEDLSPTAVRIDPWAFYPDLSETELTADSSVFELHRFTKAKLAALTKQPGFDAEAILRVLAAGTQQLQDANRDATRTAAGTVGVRDERYDVVEYTGPVDAEDLEAYGIDLGQEDARLVTYQACVWFSTQTGEVLKATLYPMDTNEQPYSVFNWQPDTACIFGFGLPYELRDLQEGGNSTFRATMDNMGLSVGPQIVINDRAIDPMNGLWVIEPNKLWRLKESSLPVSNVFGFYNIESRVNELMALFSQIKALADEIGGPLMAMQGQDAPRLAQAGATGMSIAYNAASVWMRRAIKLWDDQITTPTVGRFVDWNMQNNADPNIKGDLQVVSRGTAALLEAENQIIKLQTVIQLASQVGVPVRKVVNQLRAMVRAMRLDPDDLLPDDNEVRQMEEQAARNGPPPNPEMERIEARKAELQDRTAQREHDHQMRLMENQIRWAEIAQNSQLSAEEARQRFALDRAKLAVGLEGAREQRAHDAQKFNTEVAIKTAHGSGI
jgi:hypothetical protein